MISDPLLVQENRELPNIPYNYLNKKIRILYSEQLDEYIIYPHLPRRMENFDLWPISKPLVQSNISLSGVVNTRFEGYIEDALIREIWLADDISILSSFFYAIKRFVEHKNSQNNHLIWIPFDKVGQAFRIEPIDFVLGDSQQSRANPVHNIGCNDYRYMRDEFSFDFRILRLESLPNSILDFEGV